MGNLSTVCPFIRHHDVCSKRLAVLFVGGSMAHSGGQCSEQTVHMCVGPAGTAPRQGLSGSRGLAGQWGGSQSIFSSDKLQAQHGHSVLPCVNEQTGVRKQTRASLSLNEDTRESDQVSSVPFLQCWLWEAWSHSAYSTQLNAIQLTRVRQGRNKAKCKPENNTLDSIPHKERPGARTSSSILRAQYLPA